ncbi:hypothetical protein [Novosphingobium sp. M1R2S20]|uniref:PRC-barrel domain protein n=1 Tax=Novosphingobium rhizovicinum TaxID=3228928 RepID=A0ABV3R867_9SPHN
MKKPFMTAALAAVALSPLAAHAQAQDASAQATTSAQASTAAATKPAVGAKVFGPQGAEVGTVEKVDPANVVVNTGTKRATLPLAAFGNNEKGLLISMTRDQLNAAVAAAEAQTSSAMQAALVADAEVKSKDGVLIGTVQKVEGDNVTIDLADGNPVTVTKQYLTVAPAGGLALTMNAAEFKSAVAAAVQSGASAPAGADAQAGANAQAAGTEETAATN